MSTVAEWVYIVDDEAAVRTALSRLLRSAGLSCAAFASAAEFLEHLGDDAAGCLILDLAMPEIDGAALQDLLAKRRAALPIVFLTGHGDVAQGVSAMKKGASDFLTKPIDERLLLAAVHQALAQGRTLRQAGHEIEELRRRVGTLTQREREVLQGVIAGLLNKQIAARLGTAEKTIKIHRARVMEKMAADSVAELVRMAEKAGVRALS